MSEHIINKTVHGFIRAFKICGSLNTTKLKTFPIEKVFRSIGNSINEDRCN